MHNNFVPPLLFVTCYSCCTQTLYSLTYVMLNYHYVMLPLGGIEMSCLKKCALSKHWHKKKARRNKTFYINKAQQQDTASLRLRACFIWYTQILMVTKDTFSVSTLRQMALPLRSYKISLTVTINQTDDNTRLWYFFACFFTNTTSSIMYLTETLHRFSSFCHIIDWC